MGEAAAAIAVSDGGGRVVGRDADVALLVGTLAPADGSCCVVVVVGDRGCGASTLLAGVVARLVGHGETVTWITSADDVEPTDVGVAVVDDCEALDAEACARVEQLASAGRVRLLVSARRTMGALPELAATLLRSPNARLVEVAPLTASDCLGIARTLVGRDVDPRTGPRLRRLTDGNPAAIVRVLAEPTLTGAVGANGWCLDTAAGRRVLTATVGRPRWESLDPDGRAVVALVAIERVVVLSDVVAAWGPTVTVHAQASGLVRPVLTADRRPDDHRAMPALLAAPSWLDRSMVRSWAATGGCRSGGVVTPSTAVRAMAGHVAELASSIDCGRARDAVELAQQLDGVEGVGLPSSGEHLVALGRIQLLAGDAVAALELLLEAIDAESGEAGDVTRRQAVAGAVAAYSWLGDLDTAGALAREYDGMRSAGASSADAVAERLRSNYDLAHGDQSACVARLRSVIEDAAVTDPAGPILGVAFDLARLGEPVLAPVHVAAAASWDRRDELGMAIIDFVEAANRRDPQSMVDACARLESGGAGRLAIEAWAFAAARFAELSHTRGRIACAHRVDQLRRRGVHGWVPDAATIAYDACSDRELEVAALAASGMARRAIAETLYISTKTVDRHLNAAYAKLGVASRGELIESLAVVARDKSVGRDGRVTAPRLARLAPRTRVPAPTAVPT